MKIQRIYRQIFNFLYGFKMQKGTVKWFNDQKGFGFIESEGQEYFVHFKEIHCDGFKTLKEGDKVGFAPATSPKGPVATSVSKITQ